MENRIASYTAASVFPAKILANLELMRKIIEDRRIPPIHIQLNPTNHCNLNCAFCSCSERDKRLELSYKDISEIMGRAVVLGCESCTITGGGEPLMHPHIGAIVSRIRELGIDVGLVTNGLLLGRLSKETLSKTTWIRISSGDDRTFPNRYSELLEKAVERGDTVDWAFSHVVTAKPNYEVIKSIIKFANGHAFTHVRMVSDIFNAENVPMGKVKKKIRDAGIDDGIVIYQERSAWTAGQEKCLISLLKPVIGADGMLYPCCGTQYALDDPARDYEKSMCMGPAKDLDKIISKQACFNGGVCSKCYYSEYNSALEVLLSDVRHKKFI